MLRRLANATLAAAVTCGAAPSMAQCDPEEAAKLTATDGSELDAFGSSVGLWNETAVLGAPRDGPSGRWSGSAYVFTRIAGVWSQTAKLTADDGASFDEFGSSVGIAHQTVVVGAPLVDGDGGEDAGAAYVFELVEDAWTQTAKLTADDGAEDDDFGFSVGVTDGAIVVGAPGDDDLGDIAGAAYVFELVDGGWTQTAKLTAADGDEGDRVGWSVGIWGDVAVVGGWDNAAYVFERLDGAWTQTAKLTALDGPDEDAFGWSIAITCETVVIGAPTSDGKKEDSGAAYVFERVGGRWTQAAKLAAEDGGAFDRFAYAVAVSDDVVVAGADLESPAGAAYVFERRDGGWALSGRITASDGVDGEAFGTSVGASRDTALVGEPFDAGITGAAYAFDLNCPTGCPADLDVDGRVGVRDLLAVLAAWGRTCGREDLDGSGVVDGADVAVLLERWGPC